MEKIGFFEKIKGWFNFDTIKHKLNLSKERFFEIGIYLGVGFLVGFLLKKYAHLILWLLLFILGLVVLRQMDFITLTIDWDKVESLFGIQRTTMSASTLTLAWEWIKLNALLVISVSIGFILGLNVG
jgi:uncharacterized membrane protein (Fun14 family)